MRPNFHVDRFEGGSCRSHRPMKPARPTDSATTLRAALLVASLFLCSCAGGYTYHLKRKSSESVPPDSALALRIGEQYPDWPVPPACRGTTVVMRAGETRKAISEWGQPWKIGFLVPGLAVENERVARVRYGGGKNNGNVTLLAVAPGETRAWYVRAVGSGAQRQPDAAHRKDPADIIIRVTP